MTIIDEYRQMLDELPFTEAIEWMDDCRSVEAKVYEMRRRYKKCTSRDMQR